MNAMSKKRQNWLFHAALRKLEDPKTGYIGSPFTIVNNINNPLESILPAWELAPMRGWTPLFCFRMLCRFEHHHVIGLFHLSDDGRTTECVYKFTN